MASYDSRIFETGITQGGILMGHFREVDHFSLVTFSWIHPSLTFFDIDTRKIVKFLWDFEHEDSFCVSYLLNLSSLRNFFEIYAQGIFSLSVHLQKIY